VTTASSSTWRDTSATRSWPTACEFSMPRLAGVKFLGSYPAAGDHGPALRVRADAAWREADAWVRSLRSQINLF
jgi:hypothetical protein